jgi:hypothetical protein
MHVSGYATAYSVQAINVYKVGGQPDRVQIPKNASDRSCEIGATVGGPCGGEVVHRLFNTSIMSKRNRAVDVII